MPRFPATEGPFPYTSGGLCPDWVKLYIPTTHHKVATAYLLYMRNHFGITSNSFAYVGLVHGGPHHGRYYTSLEVSGSIEPLTSDI